MRSRPVTSGSRSARTRSAGWRKRSDSWRRTAASRWCSRWGRRRPRSSCATRWPSARIAQIHLVTDGGEWDPQATASAILDAIREDETANGTFDLVVFGNESADAGNFQIGIRVAHALGRPVATGLKALAVDGGTARCEQEAVGGRDVYELALPAVVTVKEGLNLPRYPSVPGRLRAQRKPVEPRTPERPAPRLELVRLVVPEGEGKRAEVLGEGPAAAPRVVEVLREIGVLG